MPKFMIKDSDMQQTQIPGSSMQFSAIRPDELGASEYTLVTIVVDISSSVTAFADDLLKALKEAVRSCKKSPRAENLLLRVVSFNTGIYEIHGFIPLDGIDVDTYDPFQCSGMTALRDASYNSIGATFDYAKTLIGQDFDANAIVFVITDGEENASWQSSVQDTKDLIEAAKRHEEIESIVTVLIGINVADCIHSLEDFQQAVGIDQFIDVGEATPGRLAKLAQFVSRSVSSQSQALGSGAASQPLTF